MTRAREIASNGGLVLLNNTSFSAASNVSIDNAFSATYDNYRVLIYADFSANVFCDFRFRASGADNSTSSYRNFVPNNAYNDTGISGFSGQDVSFIRIMGTSTGTKPSAMSMDIFSPQAVTNTNFLYSSAGETRAGAGGGTFNATTQFDGFSFFPQSGTITGTVRIYGVRN